MAARWSTHENELPPWLWVYWSRLGFAALSAAIVYWFPAPPMGRGFWGFLVGHTIMQSFVS
jgi:hypothetical protein